MDKIILYNKKILFFLTFIIIFLFISQASGKTLTDIIEISNEETILYVGGTGQDNYSSIQTAVDNANQGDTVYVYDDSSPYYESLIINTTINLKGENKDTTVIDANMVDDVIFIAAPGVLVSDFTLKNSGNSSSGIRIISDNISIYSNNIIDNHRGVVSYHCLNNNICNNIFINNDLFGIQLYSSDYSSIHDCYFTGSINSISIFKSTSISVMGNHLVSNRRGIDLYKSSYSEIIGNTIDGTGDLNCGLGLYWGCSTYGSSSYNTVKGNNISNCIYGIELLGEEGGILHDNIIIENNIIDNEAGIYCKWYTSDNMIYHNNIINSSYSSSWDSGANYWDNGKQGNYWSDYHDKYPDAFPKIRRPWIWNQPYEIVPYSYSKDRFPLVERWGNTKSKIMPQNLLNNNLIIQLLQKLGGII